jgi:hypothetical protein
MTTKTGNILLENIGKIITLSGEHSLDEAFFREAKQPLAAVASVLKITPIQAALFSLILEHSDEQAVSIGLIAKKMDCGKIQLFKYMDDFETLEEKSLIKTGGANPHSHGINSNLPCYYVPMNVINTLRAGRSFRNKSYNGLSPEMFFETAGGLFTAFHEEDISEATFLSEMNSLVISNKKLAFVQNLKNHNISVKPGLDMLAFSCAWLDDEDDNIPLSRLRQFSGYTVVRNLDRRFNSGEHKLISEGLISRGNDDGLADTATWTFTQKARETFFADYDLKGKKQQNRKSIIKSDSIEECPLFYPAETESRIKELINLLDEDNFRSVKQRLAERKMPAAFTILFQGSPGTGKTETVYQISRLTGRDIFLVDISETKSQWFGESEKRIKAVFSRYKSILNSSVLAPILFFNEADGVLGKRQELGDTRRGPAQTENAMQNIILSEMENLRGGILIATTNMAVNFDKAFERRFLYKIEFQKPDIEAKAAIWRSRLPELSSDAAAVLSSRYDFSGGQIQNIARKQAISSILNGSDLSIDGIVALCENETLEKSAKPIGFITSEK